MATTAVNAVLSPWLYDDAVISVSASALTVITRGDWIAASAQVGANVPNGALASPAYRVSALGLAIENNPSYDPLGRPINNTAFAVITRFVARVTASGSGSARTIPLGSHAWPASTGSGVVTGLFSAGLTGVGAMWLTAPPVGVSASIGALTGLNESGVAQVIGHPVGGDSGIGQIDIRVNLATNTGPF